MQYVAGYTLRDYVERTRAHKLLSPVVLVGRGSPSTPVEQVAFLRAHDLDATATAYLVLLVEQEDGSFETVPITR